MAVLLNANLEDAPEVCDAAFAVVSGAERVELLWVSIIPTPHLSESLPFLFECSFWSWKRSLRRWYVTCYTGIISNRTQWDFVAVLESLEVFRW